MPLLEGEKVQTASNPSGDGMSHKETPPEITEETTIEETPQVTETETETSTEQVETETEAKPETEAKADDDAWEKEYLEQFGEIKAESVHEALENYNNGKMGFDQSSGQLAKFKGLAKQLGASDLNGLAQMIEAQIPRTEQITGVELGEPDFGSITEHFKSARDELMLQHFDDPVDKQVSLQGLAASEKASMMHAQSAYNAGVKATETLMSPVIDVLAGLSAKIQGFELDSKWNSLNPVTQKTYAAQKGEIVNFIKSNPEMLMSNDPFEAAIRSMAAADPEFLKVYHKNIATKAAEKERINQIDAKRKMADKYAKGAKRSTGDGKTTTKSVSMHSSKKETAAAEAASWEAVKKSGALGF